MPIQAATLAVLTEVHRGFTHSILQAVTVVSQDSTATFSRCLQVAILQLSCSLKLHILRWFSESVMTENKYKYVKNCHSCHCFPVAPEHCRSLLQSVEFSSVEVAYMFLLTCLLTLLSRVLLEKLTGFQLVKKFLAFYGTRRFITAFTSIPCPQPDRFSPYPHIPLPEDLS